MRNWILVVTLLSLLFMQGLFIASVAALTWRNYQGDHWMLISFGAGIVSYAIIICLVYNTGHRNGSYYGAKSDL